jgi:hypothetical protein
MWLGCVGDLSTFYRWSAHFFSVPFLPAPANTLGINDAGASAAAPFIVLHALLQ